MGHNSRNSIQKGALKSRLFAGSDRKRCCFCRRWLYRINATLEHVMPISLGGGWEIENLRISCQPCNNERGAEDFETFRRRKRAEIAARSGNA